MLHPVHLRRTLPTATVVGAVLFAINQADVLLDDGWGLPVVIKAVLNFVVPFCVANSGVLAAARRPRTPGDASGPPKELST